MSKRKNGRKRAPTSAQKGGFIDNPTLAASSDSFVAGPASPASGVENIGTFKGVSRDLTPAEMYALIAPVQNGVDRISENLNKATLRLFSRSGAEITGGPLYDLFNSHPHLIHEMVVNWHVYGEIAVRVQPSPLGTGVKLRVLSPSRLGYAPRTAKSLDEVTEWVERELDGTETPIKTKEVVFVRRYDPRYPVRGSTLLRCIENEANAYYQGARYVKSFFDNNAKPATIVAFKQPLSRAQKQDTKHQFESQYSAINGDAFGTMVTGGSEVDVKTLEAGLKDLDITTVQAYWSQVIYARLGVPPVVANDNGSTRFDSAAEELYSFATNTLSPLAAIVNQVLTQIVAKLPASMFSGGTVAKYDVSKSVHRSLSKVYLATDEQTVALLDEDTLPAMLEARRYLLEFALQLTKLGVSFNDAIEYVGLDIEAQPYRDAVLVPSGQVNLVTGQPLVQPPAPAAGPTSSIDGGAGQDQPPAPEPQPNDSTKEVEAQVRKLLATQLRPMVLRAVEAGERLTLRKLDAVAGEPFRAVTRRLFNELTRLGESRDSESVKGVFNRLGRRESLAKLARLVGVQHE